MHSIKLLRLKKILILNGPNLNLLGIREPNLYGRTSLEAINSKLTSIAQEHNIQLKTFQSNSESELINQIHSALNETNFIIINPAGFTHTSIALRDALLTIKIPFIEIHLSNILSREEFRHKSFFSDIAIGTISGLGENGYNYALNYAIDYLYNKE
jgi:3-dehydroquinate dehydratase-2